MARTKKSYPKKDHYKVVTDRIIESLEKGVAPWVKPWNASSDTPQNGHTGHKYRGINIMLCWASGHADPRWYTFKQVRSGKYGMSHVKKGSAGTPILKWLFKDRTEEDADGNIITNTTPILVTFTVFNHEQVEWEEGKEPMLPEEIEGNKFDPAEACAAAAALLDKTEATVKHGGTRAYYRSTEDYIGMPRPETFKTPEDYWSTLLHEVSHWTGHSSRCNRDLGNRFGSEAYAMEELIAELGSAFLCVDLGIQGKLQHEEYIGEWIKKLQSDKYAVFTAARLAKNAVAHLEGDKATVTPAVEEKAAQDTAQAA
jgi:antirestriction protein ArdC